MSTYFGTDSDDRIEGTDIPAGVDRIDPLAGNDTLVDLTSISVIASPGNDTISGENLGYMLWRAPESPSVNLKEGTATDGFGFQDSLQGITTVQLPNNKAKPLDAIVIGSDEDETVYVFAGNNTIDLGLGNDKVIFYQEDINNYKISPVNNRLEVSNLITNTTSTISGVETLVFIPQSRNFDERTEIATEFISSTISASVKEVIHQFKDKSIDPDGRLYEGVRNDGGLLNWFIQTSMLIDLNEDGKKDVVLAMSKGYASGENTQTPFIALTSKNGTLHFDETANSKMPITSSAVEAEPINLALSESQLFVTVNIDTREVSARNGYKTDPAEFPSELIIVQPTNSTLEPLSIFPELPESIPGFPLAVNAHSLAVGDVNNDGLEDVIVSQGGSSGGFQLTQTQDGNFLLTRDSFQRSISTGYWLNDDGTEGDNGITSQTLVDVDNDGFDDLIVGWGHTGATSSYVFLNSNGTFSKDNRKQIPPSIYGVDNQNTLKILSEDLDHDGDPDLAIQYVRQQPFYGGDYWQILTNDGNGNFTDVSETITNFNSINSYGVRQSNSMIGQLIDLNNDGHIDLATTNGTSKRPLFYINDGLARFDILEVPFLKWNPARYLSEPALYYDFDEDGRMEFVSMLRVENAENTESTIKLYLYEFSTALGTGPNYAQASSFGAVGFNEQYYLNTYPDIKKQVSQGKYRSGLEHYLAEGKQAGLSSFAPFTKISGGSGIDTLTLPMVFSKYAIDTSEKHWEIDEVSTTSSYSATDIERISFSDKDLAFDLNANAGSIVKLLGALIGRGGVENPSYVGEGLKLLDDGMSYSQLIRIAANFVLGSNPESTNIVNLIYKNVVGTDAPQDLIDQYSNLIDSNELSIEQFVMSAAEHPLNAENINLVGLAITGVEYIPATVI